MSATTQVFYVDSATGSNSDDGLTAANAWLTLAYAITQLPSDNWVLYCKGTFLEANPTFSSFANFVIQPAPGETNFQVNGYVALAFASLTAVGAYYTFTPTGNVMIGQIGYAYVNTQRLNARPLAFVPRAASLAAAQTTPNSWWQDTSTKLVTFYPHASMTIDANVDLCWFRSGNGLALTGCSAGTLRGCVLYGWVGADETTGLPSIDTGYGILVNGGSYDLDIEDCEVRGFGGHGMGAVNNQREIRFTDCIIRTGRKGVGGTAFVFHSNTDAGIANQLTGDRCLRVDLYLDGLYDIDGAAIIAGTLAGFYTHGGNAQTPTDVAFTDCTVQCYDDTECRYALGSGVTAATVADEKVFANYPVRYDRCTVIDGHGQQMTLSDPTTTKYQIAYRRCYIETSRNGSLTTETYLWNIEGTASQILFDACVLVGSDNDADTGGMRFINLANSPTVVMINSAFVNSPGAAAQPILYYNSTTAIVKAYGTLVMASTTNSRLVGGAVTVLSTQTIFVGCWYYKFTSTTGYNNTDAALNQQSEWQAAIDTTGVYAVDPVISTADLGAVAPTALGALTTRTAFNSVHSTTGYNGNTYSSHYGPWQYGVDEDVATLTGRAATRTRNYRNLVR